MISENGLVRFVHVSQNNISFCLCQLTQPPYSFETTGPCRARDPFQHYEPIILWFNLHLEQLHACSPRAANILCIYSNLLIPHRDGLHVFTQEFMLVDAN